MLNLVCSYLPWREHQFTTRENRLTHHTTLVYFTTRVGLFENKKQMPLKHIIMASFWLFNYRGPLSLNGFLVWTHRMQSSRAHNFTTRKYDFSIQLLYSRLNRIICIQVVHTIWGPYMLINNKEYYPTLHASCTQCEKKTSIVLTTPVLTYPEMYTANW